MGIGDHIAYYLPLILLLGAFAAMIWADNNNPLQVFTSLPSVFVPAMEFPKLR